MKNIVYGFVFVVCYVLASIPFVNTYGARGWYFIAAAGLIFCSLIILLNLIGKIISDVIKAMKGEEIDDFV